MKEKEEKALYLDEDWRIVSDEICYTLQRKRVGEKGKSKDKVIWMNYGYHSRLDQVFVSAAEHISLENWPDLQVIIKKVDAIREIVSKFMREIST